MGREINRLTTKGVEALKEPGLHADGQGLYLRIDQTLNRRWVFVFFWRGKRREMGLGPETSTNGLKVARNAAETARRLLGAGVDPIAARRLGETTEPTFGEMALEVIEAKKAGWAEITAHQWQASLEQHATAIWNLPVSQVNETGVLKVLKPIWQTIPETADRVRMRIEFVLDAAKVSGHRQGENPARWRGHLKLLLSRAAVKVRHHPALPYEEMPRFMEALRAREAMSARALEWTILAAARTGDTLGATPDEIDGDVWTIPAARYKTRRDHRVAITDRMHEILAEVRPLWVPGAYVFPGDQRVEPLSSMSMLMLLRRMGIDVTVHGFRSTFRDWAGDCTPYAREVIEGALGHTVGDMVERAYRRRDGLEKRRPLMVTWATFCTTPPNANVKPFVRPADSA